MAAETQGLDLLAYLDVVAPEIVAHTVVLMLVWVLLVPYNTYRIALRRNEYGFDLSNYVTYQNIVVVATLVGSAMAFFFNRNRGAGNFITPHGQIGGAVTGAGLALALGFFPRTLGRLTLVGGVAALATGFDSTVALFGDNDQLNIVRLGTLGLFALFLLFLLRGYSSLAPSQSADVIPGIPNWARRLTAVMGGGGARQTDPEAMPGMPQPGMFQRVSRLFGGQPEVPTVPPRVGRDGDGFGGGMFQRFTARLNFGGGNTQAVQPYSGGSSFPGAFDDQFKPSGMPPMQMSPMQMPPMQMSPMQMPPMQMPPMQMQMPPMQLQMPGVYNNNNY
jgi:hypothetical protein